MADDQDTAENNRRRRSLDENEDYYNSDDIQFYFGFAFDDADLYHNISEDLPSIGQLTVYKDPEFDLFTERDRVRLYQPYWPFSDKELLLYVRWVYLLCLCGFPNI